MFAAFIVNLLLHKLDGVAVLVHSLHIPCTFAFNVFKHFYCIFQQPSEEKGVFPNTVFELVGEGRDGREGREESLGSGINIIQVTVVTTIKGKIIITSQF